jgi:hypothetical protein
MSILERIRATDRMQNVVEELAQHAGMKDAMEFQNRIAVDDQGADIAFLEMAEDLWVENRDLLRDFFRHYFHRLSREHQWQVAYTLSGSFLDRSPIRKRDEALDLMNWN